MGQVTWHVARETWNVKRDTVPSGTGHVARKR